MTARPRQRQADHRRSRTAACRCAVVALLVLVSAGRAAPARADADPASDVLLNSDVYLPADPQPSSSAGGQLVQTLVAADNAGYRIKVAVIGTSTDLGGVTLLWLKPKRYARFLASELRFLYRGRLLVAMPNGFGFADHGRPVPAADRTLAGVPIGQGGDGIVRSSAEAVRVLAAASGRPLLPRSSASGGRSAWGDRAVLGGIVLAIAAVLGALALARRRQRPTA